MSDAEIVETLRDLSRMTHRLYDDDTKACAQAADRLEAQAATIERLRGLLLEAGAYVDAHMEVQPNAETRDLSARIKAEVKEP